jgi:hypothetical protein
MSLTVVSVAVLAVLVGISLLITARTSRSLVIFKEGASRYGGITKGGALYPRLVFSLDGGQARLSHQWSRRAAAGGQLVFRRKFLVFVVSAAPLPRDTDVLIYTRIGWTTIVRQVGFQAYVTGDPAFDARFVVFAKGPKGRIAALLDEDLRRQIGRLKDETEVLEVAKAEQIFRIKFQKRTLEGAHMVDRVLQDFLAIYRRFATA